MHSDSDTCQHRPKRSRIARSRKEVVERAEAHVRVHIGVKISLAQLCRVVGFSERGLRNSFYEVRGLSPKRSMLHERLRTVRGVLRDARASRTTVTDVATGHGFYELGRFAGAYKQMFGEAPSQTLHGGCPAPRARRMASTKGDGHAGAN